MPKWKLSHTHTLSVVGHVSGGGAELGIGFDDLVNGLQEVLLRGDLPAGSDGEHAGLCAHAADLSAWQETHIKFGLEDEQDTVELSHSYCNTHWCELLLLPCCDKVVKKELC